MRPCVLTKNTSSGIKRRGFLKAITLAGVTNPALSHLALASTGYGVTAVDPWEARILPKCGRARQRFLILDPYWRLVPATLVLFTDLQTLDVESTTLRRFAPFGQLGRGRIPALAPGATYTVSIQLPDQAVFGAGTFCVRSPHDVDALIDPESGLPGSAFSIYDPAGRMHGGDVVLFFANDTDPAAGATASNVQVTPDGKTLAAEVPMVAGGIAYGVSVRPTFDGTSRFNDLEFFVEEAISQDPTIVPEMGGVGTDLMITDPQERMQATDVCTFHPPGVDPDPSSVAPGTIISADGMILRCKVPNVTVQRTYEVTVRPTLVDVPRFGALTFFVEGEVPEPTIFPGAGPPGSSFEIDDSEGRMQSGDIAIFYLPGMDPTSGTQVVDPSIGSDGTRLTGTVPNVATGLVYLVTVRPDATAPARFSDLTFAVI